MVPRRRVAGPPPPPIVCPPRPPPPQATPLVPANSHTSSLPPQARPHGTTRQGTTGAGWGRITHNTGNQNHRAPSPSPSPPRRHTDDNDGDDVVHNDVDVLFPVWLLVVPFLLCCSGLRQRMFIALLVENRAWLVMFLRKLYRPFVTPSRVSVGFAFMYA